MCCDHPKERPSSPHGWQAVKIQELSLSLCLTLSLSLQINLAFDLPLFCFISVCRLLKVLIPCLIKPLSLHNKVSLSSSSLFMCLSICLLPLSVSKSPPPPPPPPPSRFPSHDSRILMNKTVTFCSKCTWTRRPWSLTRSCTTCTIVLTWSSPTTRLSSSSTGSLPELTPS